MIAVHPFDDTLAMDVIRGLDPIDRMEAEAVRGTRLGNLALWADWRALSGMCIGSWIVRRAATGLPVAIVALAPTGQVGVASAAMLARNHRTYRRELARAARHIRINMPRFCADHGIHRVEARAWADHPRACAFLTLTGFRFEADLPGFGPDGRLKFRQFAWVDPSLTNPRQSIPHSKETKPCA